MRPSTLARGYVVLALLSLASLACSGSIPGLEPVPASPTPTVTATPTLTLTITLTPVVAATPVMSPTPQTTDTLTVTPSFTPPPTVTPSFTPTDTPVPGEEVGCDASPDGGFARIFADNPGVPAALGCPAGSRPAAHSMQVAYQSFENGAMVWASGLAPGAEPAIYVLYGDGVYQRLADTWDESQPVSSGEAPPANRHEPTRGFGKVWREQPGVRDALGWALRPEQGGAGVVQIFDRGEMVYLSPVGQTYIFAQGAPGSGASWQINPTPF